MIKELLKKIEESNNNQDKNNYKLQLANEYYNYNDYIESLNLLFDIKDYFKNDKNNYLLIINLIINNYLKLKEYHEISDYLEIKKSLLPSYQEYLINYDKANIYYEKKKYNNCFTIYNNLLKDDLTIEQKLDIYIKLFNITLINKDFQKTKSYLDYIKLNSNNLSLIKYLEILLLKEENNFDEMINKINTYLELNLDTTYKLKILLLYLEYLIDINDYKRASLYESEYEELFLNSNLDIQKKFFNLCIEIYENLNNKISLNIYKDRLEELNKRLKKEIKKGNKQLKNDKDIKTNLNNLDNNIKYTDLYEYDNKISYLLSFNEYYRQFCLSIYNEFLIPEILFIVKKDNYLETYQFKKERVYDRIKEENDFTNTIFEKEKRVYNKIELSNYYDFILNKEYKNLDYKFLFFEKLDNYYITFQTIDPFNINYNISKHFITFFKIIIKKYELLKDLENFKNNYKVYYDIFYNNDVLSYFSLDDNLIINNPLKNLLNYDTNIINELDFYNLIDNNYLNKYQEYYNYFKMSKVIKSSTILKFNNNKEIYKENSKRINNIRFSILENITNSLIKKDEIVNDYYIDKLTNIYNKNKLDEDLNNYLNKNKFSLIGIDIINFSTYNDIYGYNEGDKLLINLALKLNKYQIYRLYADKFILIMENNDKRFLNKFIIALNEELKEINKNINFFISYLRYPIDTKDKNINNLYKYLDINKKYNTQYFNSLFYKKEIFLKHTKNLIEKSFMNNDYQIKYHQIVDIKNKKVLGFIPILYFNKIDLDYNSYNLFKNEELFNKFDKEILNKSFEHLNFIYKQTNKLIKCFLKINLKTFLSSDFKDYYQNLLLKYNINKKQIDLLIDIDNIIYNKEELKIKINEFSNYINDLYLNDLNMILSNKINYFTNYDNEKLDQLLNLNKIINNILVTNVNKIEEINNLLNINIKYITGNYYDKEITIDTIINQIK